MVGAMPALAKTWSILPYSFSASLNLYQVSKLLKDGPSKVATLTSRSVASNLSRPPSRKALNLPQARVVG
jgi:hypothetical protein